MCDIREISTGVIHEFKYILIFQSCSYPSQVSNGKRTVFLFGSSYNFAYCGERVLLREHVRSLFVYFCKTNNLSSFSMLIYISKIIYKTEQETSS